MRIVSNITTDVACGDFISILTCIFLIDMMSLAHYSVTLYKNYVTRKKNKGLLIPPLH